MITDLSFLVLGLGNGAVYAALGLALVLTYKSSGVVNFATGAIALYAAYTFAFLRQGSLLIPVPGLPSTVDLGAPVAVGPAIVVAVAVSALVGLVLHAVVFRPLRNAPPVATAVAAIGVMLVLQALLALRVGDDTPTVAPIFAPGTVSLGGTAIPTDRLLLATTITAVAVVAAIVLRHTRFGLATEAAAESERGALLSGLSPTRIAAANWAVSSAVAGLGGVLISPIVPLNPGAYTLFIVPALAAALVGDFRGVTVTAAAGLAVGMVQSEATHLQVSVSWFPDAGVAEAVPLVLIVVFLLVRGRSLPARGAVVRRGLGRSPRPRRLLLPGGIGAIIGLAALATTTGSIRLAVIISIISAIIALSLVVVTGYAGQVSLGQLAMAGVGAYTLTRLGSGLGIPFPVAPLLAAVAAGAAGVVMGLPALRVRGLPLMVTTLAAAVFVDAVWFQNPSLNGGLQGAPIDPPRLAGLDLDIGAGEGYPRFAFGVVCLVTLLAVALGVGALRRSRLGASLLAVRAGERSAAAAGIDVGRTKLLAFALGSFVAGLGGCLLAYQQTLATAQTYGVFAGIGVFAVAYIAGVTSITGAVLAGVMAPGGIVYFLSDRFLGSGDYYLLMSGVLLVVVVVVAPDGLAGPLLRTSAALRHRRDTAPDPSTPAPTTPAASTPAGSTAVLDPQDAPTVLAARGMTVRYGAVTALDDVHIEVRQGEIVGIVGPNGSGKTTLMDALSGFVDGDGEVSVDGTRARRRAPHARSRLGLGRSFQDIELYETLTVAENVAVGVRGPSRDTAGIVAEVLQRLQIDEFADVLAGELSQGRRQLVSVARVLAARPTVALLDEPAAGLDSTESAWLGDRLRAARDHGVSIVVVEHDMGLVMGICDRVVVLDLGRVIAAGTPAEVSADPAVRAAYLGTARTPDDPNPTTETRSVATESAALTGERS